jgi:hypothetical protein
MAVEAELAHMGLHFTRIELGLSDITEDITIASMTRSDPVSYRLVSY